MQGVVLLMDIGGQLGLEEDISITFVYYETGKKTD
jgi:hypothetical protein